MKQHKLPFLLCMGFLMLLLSCGISKHIEKENEKSEHENIAGILREQFNNIKDPATGTAPVERLLIAKQRQQDLFADQTLQRAVPGISWQERGPNNVAGRIRAVLIDKNEATNKKVWVGGVNGGLWFTNDISVPVPQWNRIDDFLENLTITCLAQDPSNASIIYAGTGEGVDNGAPRGLGIYKTTNAGATWVRLTNTNGFTFVNDLEFDKNGKLYAAVRTDAAGQSGIMRTADAGANWVNVLTTPTASTDMAVDVAVSKDGDMYAALGVGSAGAKGCIFISNQGATAGDAGTWTNITPNASGVITDPSATALWQRIRLATAPSDNNVMYAVMQGPTSSICEGLMQYNKSTNSWAVRTVPKIIDQEANPAARPTFTRDQAWWGLTAAVDPNNAAVLCVSGIDACRTNDNGQTWNQISAWTVNANEQAAGFTNAQIVHADQHDFTFVGGSSSTAILATDGGIFYSTNINSATKPTFVSKNIGLNITQYYAGALHPTNTNYFLGGSQDNGSQKFTQAGIGATTDVSGGDGAFCHIDQVNGNVQITSYTNNNYYISTDGGATFPTAGAAINNQRGKFINPTDFDGTNLYGADDANNFYRINNVPNAGRTGDKVACTQFGGQISHVAISKNTAHKVYFGIGNGNIVKVDAANAGTTVTGVLLGTPRAATVSSLGFSLTNAAEDSMLVTYSNYGGSKVFLGTALNGTPAFRDITGNLPDIPVRWGMFDPRSSNMVIIATDLGVWSCDDITVATPQWNTTNNILANTRVDMLKYRPSDRTILAASHGRGMFTTIVPPNLNPEINFALGSTNAEAEKTTSTVGCRNFTDYNVQVNINGAPSANADITLSHTGTATEGVDFDYSTNNVFGAGNSKLLSFASGSAESKSFKIRVYDDAIVDPNEIVVFSFTVNNNGGNGAVGVTAPTQTFTITDNDVAINSGTAINSSQIGASENNTTDVWAPFVSTGAKYLTQNIYTAAELTAAGLSSGSSISGLSLKVLTKNSTSAFVGFTIRMANTAVIPSASTTYQPNATYTTCYSADYSTVMGDNNFTFTTPFVWDGTSNVLVVYCYTSTTVTSGDDILSGVTDALGAGVRATIASSHANIGTGCTIPSSYSSSNSSWRPVVKFTHNKPATVVATAANAQKIENVQQNTGEYNFYSSNNLVAGIKNISTDLGCVTSSVADAGNGFTPFQGQAGTNKSTKVWSITPTTNGSTATYTVTLYMTTAELAGQATSGLKIYKSSAANIASATGANTVTAPTTVATSADGTWTSFTATFTGFSIFFIGSNNIVLPLSDINFSGVKKNGFNQLQWKTTNEIDVKHYVAEWSTDNVRWNTVGVVNANGFSSSYDLQHTNVPTGKVFYRLKIVNNTGEFTYSNIIWINKDGVNTITVYPSPVYDVLNINISNTKLLNTTVKIIDANGKVIRNVLLKNYQQQIDVLNLTNGLYILKFEDGSSQKIIKN
jgi:trimeric autotransporter adhesin